MNTRTTTFLMGLVLAGMMSATVAADATPYTGRRADHVLIGGVPASSAEFSAMEAQPVLARSEHAYTGRRADHIPMLLNTGKTRAEFAAMEGRSVERAAPTRTEPAYSGRRTDHPEVLRNPAQ